MKILQICPWLSDSPFKTASGVSQAAYYISYELARRGHDVTLCASAVNAERRTDNIARATSEKVTIIRFPYILGSNTFLLTPGFISYLRKNLQDFDVIHIHDLRHFQALIANHYAVRNRVPYVLQAHGAVVPLRKKGAAYFFDVIWGKKIIKEAELLIALTDQEVDEYKSIGGLERKIRVLPNGVDLSEFADLPQKGDFRRKHTLQQNEQVILFLGRISKVKGLDLLVSAFSLLRRDVEGARLVIVGPDEDGTLIALKQQAIELGLRDEVLFVGPLYERDKLEAYVDADVYVLPSRYETFPFTVLEAWACGTPVIATDRCGISELVKKAGCVVEFNESQLYEALSSVLKHKDWREQASKSGQDLVRREFSWDRIINELEALYREVRRNNKTVS